MRLAVLALVILAGCATTPFVAAPPALYRASDGQRVTVQVVATARLPALCASQLGSEPNAATVGCYVAPVVYLPNPCEWSDPYAQTFCHELGHARGWPRTHPS